MRKIRICCFSQELLLGAFHSIHCHAIIWVHTSKNEEMMMLPCVYPNHFFPLREIATHLFDWEKLWHGRTHTSFFLHAGFSTQRDTHKAKQAYLLPFIPFPLSGGVECINYSGCMMRRRLENEIDWRVYMLWPVGLLLQYPLLDVACVMLTTSPSKEITCCLILSKQ